LGLRFGRAVRVRRETPPDIARLGFPLRTGTLPSMLRFPHHRCRRSSCICALVSIGLAAAVLGGCGGSSDSGAAPSVTAVGGTIDEPVVMNLYPNQSATTVPRLMVMVTSVGSAAVSMPLIFDTGSAGVTLYAPSIFPSSMVTAAGFVFPSGQTSITYAGITVTNQQGTRTYGSTDLRAENGNIGYAQLTFGDAQGHLKTGVMPVFLYYSTTDVATGLPVEVPSTQQGIFGVASTSGTIALPGSVEPSGGYPACAAGTNSTCYVVSVLKYLQYGSSVSAGFMLSPASIQSCDIGTAGSCAPAPMLTIGLNSTLKAGFSTVSLPCPPSGYVGPANIAGYPVCQKTIDDTTVMVSGGTVGTVVGGAVFDTGTADMQIAIPAGGTFPPMVSVGSSVLMTTPSGFSYSYITTIPDPLATIVNADFSGSTIIGIGYFTTNSFFIDFGAATEGWK